MTTNDSTTLALTTANPRRLAALARQPLTEIAGADSYYTVETEGDPTGQDSATLFAYAGPETPHLLSEVQEPDKVWAYTTHFLPPAARARISAPWLDWILGTSDTAISEYFESSELEDALRTYFRSIDAIGARLAKVGFSHSSKWCLLQRIQTWKFDKIKALYSLRNQERVRLFLFSNPFLFELLGEIRTNISEHLSGAEVYLEVVEDPEIPDEVQIIVSVVADKPFDDLCASFDRFEETWWLDNLYRAKEKVCILLEFA